MVEYEARTSSLASLILRERHNKEPSAQLLRCLRAAATYIAKKHKEEPLHTAPREYREYAHTWRGKCELYNEYLKSQLEKINDEMIRYRPLNYLLPSESQEARQHVETLIQLRQNSGQRLVGVNGDFGPANGKFRRGYLNVPEEKFDSCFLVVDKGSIHVGDPAHDVIRMGVHLTAPLMMSKNATFWARLLREFFDAYQEKRPDKDIADHMPLPYWRMVIYLLNNGGGLMRLAREESRREFVLHGLEVLRRGSFFIPTLSSS